jgi:hypothetical protein
MVIIEVMRSPWLDLPKGSYELRFGLDVNLIDLRQRLRHTRSWKGFTGSLDRHACPRNPYMRVIICRCYCTGIQVLLRVVRGDIHYDSSWKVMEAWGEGDRAEQRKQSRLKRPCIVTLPMTP